MVTALALCSCAKNNNPDSLGSVQSGVTAPAPKTVLIYNGQGSCGQTCADSTSQLVTAAGLTPKVVTSDLLSGLTSSSMISTLFQDAVALILPGGAATSILAGMSPMLMNEILSFIQGGGGYAGFDAGALISTALVGNTNVPGLGIFPGQILTSSSGGIGTIFGDLISGNLVKLFTDVLGPVITGFGNLANPVGRYSNNTVAAATTTFGAGKVFVSGTQPTTSSGQDIATNMIKWVSNL